MHPIQDQMVPAFEGLAIRSQDNDAPLLPIDCVRVKDDYDRVEGINDIAIVSIAMPLHLKVKNAKIAALPDSNERSYKNEDLLVVGFGAIGENYGNALEYPNTLQKEYLSQRDEYKFKDGYQLMDHLFATPNAMCAIRVNGEAKTIIGAGDIGGK